MKSSEYCPKRIWRELRRKWNRKDAENQNKTGKATENYLGIK